MSIHWMSIFLFQILQQNLALPQNSREKEIKQLEIERSALFKEINDAIDDSVTTLKKSNTSDALLGISYIKDLQKQIKVLNGTGSTDNVNYENEEGITSTIDDKSDLENRRSLKKTHVGKKGSNSSVALDRRSMLKDIIEAEKKKSKIELGYFESMKDNSKKWRERYQARLSIQKRLDDWIAQREREKQKIKEVKQKRMLFKEKCPRQGVKNKKKKSKRGTKGKSGKRYPCCRKCCKKSYMGCLRKK